MLVQFKDYLFNSRQLCERENADYTAVKFCLEQIAV